MKILTIIVSSFFLVACSPIPVKHTYAHPYAVDGVTETIGQICDSYDVPTVALVINALAGVEFRVISHAKKGKKDFYDLSRGTGFAVLINIPEGVVAQFSSDKFIIEDKKSRTVFEHRQEEIEIPLHYGVSPWFSAGAIVYRRYRPALGFKDKLIGATEVEKWGAREVRLKEGYLIVFNMDNLKAKWYSLTLPEIIINGKRFQVPTIDFKVQTGFFVQPFNC